MLANKGECEKRQISSLIEMQTFKHKDTSVKIL